jgi:uncharacterized protein (TIGR01777 family)
MHVAITGATGLIGSALSTRLRSAGHRVTAISRSAGGADTITWDPAVGRLDPSGLADVDAVVHLAGKPVASGRWTPSVKRRIRASRTLGTDLIARTIAEMDPGPRVLVSSSGVNYYGDRGEEVLTEDSSPGSGFLAEVCKHWEAATAPASAAGARVVQVRTGVVQSPRGGALKVQLPLYRLGLGGRLGSGGQFVSWISIEDMVGIMQHALETDALEGPVNATAPHPVTQGVYAKTLAEVLGRRTFVPVPAFGPRLLLGEMADEMLFISQRVLPEKVTASGYTFRHPTIDEALRALLGRGAS